MPISSYAKETFSLLRARFRSKYNFMFKKYLPDEIKKLRKQLAKSNDAEIVDELKKNISWIDKQLKSESVQHTDAAILAEHKKKQREAAKKGKQPFYLSKIIVILLSPPLSL
ncbi:rRNA biogenesis protein RRP36-like isoform X2 [Castanea sativa]|uniref:rRNA biogenesis protein RRP36-like isoform X2 n=1 Tax=Castanea sativa TaxID=21020 RepID=UPI003F6538F8